MGSIRDFFQGAAQQLPASINNANEFALRSRRLAMREESNRIREENIKGLNKNREQQKLLNDYNIMKNILTSPPGTVQPQINFAVKNRIVAEETGKVLSKLKERELEGIQKLIGAKQITPQNLMNLLQNGTAADVANALSALNLQISQTELNQSKANLARTQAGQLQNLGGAANLTGEYKNRYLSIKAKDPNMSDADAIQLAIVETDKAKNLRSSLQGTFKEKQTESTIGSVIQEIDPLVKNIFQTDSFKGRIGESFRNMVDLITQEGARAEDLALYRDLKKAVAGQFAKVVSGEGGRLTDQDIARVLGLFPREFGTAFLPDTKAVAAKKMAFFHKSLSRLRKEILEREGIEAKGGLPEAFKRVSSKPQTESIDITPEMALKELRRRGTIK